MAGSIPAAGTTNADERSAQNAAARGDARRRWLAVVACVPWIWSTRAAAAERRDWPSRRAAPAIELSSFDGRPWSLAAARGRPLLLNFWASWCEPCRSEMPSLEKLAARHRDGGLQVMAINYREPVATVRRFVDATSFGLPVLLDPDGAAAKAFDVHVFPSTVIVDRRGRVRSVVVGECDWQTAPGRDWVAAAL